LEEYLAFCVDRYNSHTLKHLLLRAAEAKDIDRFFEWKKKKTTSDESEKWLKSWCDLYLENKSLFMRHYNQGRFRLEDARTLLGQDYINSIPLLRSV